MVEWNVRANDIFARAAEIDAPAERGHFLQQQCGDDMDLRAQVESLLAAAGKLGTFLEKPAAALAANGMEIPASMTERPGSVIGPYKLLQEIGEGGMGVVFLAEQTEPVRRKVALKIIKPGMDSAQIIARFEAERQALALMDHPNIAKVLDAGATTSGRPFFVMELVKGVPITEFCDQNRLTPCQRLDLFMAVCDAVQHAHMKGIIHRDIKPSNVLIALYDGKPVPKVIDFGVAKAIAEPLTEKTLFTKVGQIVGTLEYMSPEQATLNQLDIDTRSDIYSLGVLLYELLTGFTPLDKERLRTLALDELLRAIREEEAPRPSTKLSHSGGGLAAAAAYRSMSSQTLASLLRGELDWIAMKALEKERARRYPTASALAADVHRYLKNETVEACPPSAFYRLRKMARRNRVALTTCGIVAAALLLGTGVSAWQAVEATTARELADDRLALEKQARANEEKHRRAAVDHARRADEQRRLVESSMALALRTLEQSYHRQYSVAVIYPKDQAGRDAIAKDIALYEEFARKESAVETEGLRCEMGKANIRLGGLHIRLKDWDGAEAPYRRGIATLEKLAAQFPAVHEYREHLQVGYFWFAEVLHQLQRRTEADELLRKHLALSQVLVAEVPANEKYHEKLQHILRKLANSTDKPQEALQFAEQRLQVIEKLVADVPDTESRQELLADGHHSVAWVCVDRDFGDAKSALVHAKWAVKLVPSKALHWITLGAAHYRNGEWQEAKAALDRPVALKKGRNGRNLFFLAMVHWKLGDETQARTLFKRGQQWMLNNEPKNAILERLCGEAAALIGIDMPGPKTRD